MLMKLLRPSFWFSAHLHVKFEATFSHSLKIVNPDEILLDDDDESQKSDAEVQSQNTQFLALDKILPGREFYKARLFSKFLDIGNSNKRTRAFRIYV